MTNRPETRRNPGPSAILLVGCVVPTLLAAACVEAGPPVAPPSTDLGLVAAHTGHAPTGYLEVAPRLSKADTIDGYKGPKLSGLPSSTAVWDAVNAWSDVDPQTGLSYHEAFAAWVDGLAPTLGFDGTTTTFELTTPWGRTLPAPALECAEAAMFLRAAYAAWNGLPFYLAAWSPSAGATIYFGHFGVVHSDGSAVSGYPKFTSWYDDYTGSHGDLPTAQLLAEWPSDTSLAGKSLSSSKDDAVPFLGPDAHAGAYFDAAFLNKRVGHFLFKLLTNLGSMHLVDTDRNTFELEPEAIRPGDVLLQRWQAQGIGHTVQVMRVEELLGDTLEVEVVFGSMPRIQPKWKEPNLAKPYFTSQYSGGPDISPAGVPYVEFGGGLKRWRAPVVAAGRWRNVVPEADVDAWIDSTDLDALAARPAELDALLGQLSPEEQQDVLLTQIAEARAELEKRPASCSNRRKREEAFAELVALNKSSFGMSAAETDAQFRTFADYVFAELVYEVSKTCCWNSTTSAMYEIILSYAESQQADEGSASCEEPVVFKATGGGYAAFADYAAEMGQADAWLAWSADESCPQADVVNDTEEDHDWTPWCELQAATPDDEPEDEPEDDGGSNGGGGSGGGGDIDDWVEDQVDDAVDDGWWGCGSGRSPAGATWLLGLLALAGVRRRVARHVQ